jgi:hypothetical protein
MENFTISLTRYEMDLLINATFLTSLKYKRPEMTEAAREGAKDYAILCDKLYKAQLEQLETDTTKEKIIAYSQQ